MIEITCTEKEKEKLISLFEIMPIPCLFPAKAKTCFLSKDNNCRKCCETKIKWNIRQRGSKKNIKEG